MGLLLRNSLNNGAEPTLLPVAACWQHYVPTSAQWSGRQGRATFLWLAKILTLHNNVFNKRYGGRLRRQGP
tara:strand:- start:1439 stop:1651 length:213 start_codon:yes stop_codon:yes gene_type:complete